MNDPKPNQTGFSALDEIESTIARLRTEIAQRQGSLDFWLSALRIEKAHIESVRSKE